jgi:hypothetical protein
MSERWEYTLIYWTYSTKFEGEEIAFPSGERQPKQLWRAEFRIVRPGGESESRLGYSTYPKDEEVEETQIAALLNELGAEGWELVSETVYDSTIVSARGGWQKAGMPIEVRWTLKRRLEP